MNYIKWLLKRIPEWFSTDTTDGRFALSMIICVMIVTVGSIISGFAVSIGNILFFILAFTMTMFFAITWVIYSVEEWV